MFSNLFNFGLPPGPSTIPKKTTREKAIDIYIYIAHHLCRTLLLMHWIKCYYNSKLMDTRIWSIVCICQLRYAAPGDGISQSLGSFHSWVRSHFLFLCLFWRFITNKQNKVTLCITSFKKKVSTSLALLTKHFGLIVFWCQSIFLLF